MLFSFNCPGWCSPGDWAVMCCTNLLVLYDGLTHMSICPLWPRLPAVPRAPACPTWWGGLTPFSRGSSPLAVGPQTRVWGPLRKGVNAGDGTPTRPRVPRSPRAWPTSQRARVVVAGGDGEASQIAQGHALQVAPACSPRAWPTCPRRPGPRPTGRGDGTPTRQYTHNSNNNNPARQRVPRSPGLTPFSRGSSPLAAGPQTRV